jgi:hypothetical protein
MIKLIFIVILTLLPTFIWAQQSDSIFQFSGYVFDNDSLPVENAYLINYRDFRAFSTDENGRFNFKVHKGDSLKILHISFDPVVVKPQTNYTNDTSFFLSYELNIIETVQIKNRNIEMEYFYKNMDNIRKQLAKEYHYQYQSGAVRNPYAPFQPNSGFIEINFIDLFRQVSKKLKK